MASTACDVIFNLRLVLRRFFPFTKVGGVEFVRVDARTLGLEAEIVGFVEREEDAVCETLDGRVGTHDAAERGDEGWWVRRGLK